jgi:hypothetical protein
MATIVVASAFACYWGGLLFLVAKKQKAARAEIVLEPLEEAHHSLKQLDSTHLLRKGRTKAYYSRLTDILKRYLYRRSTRGSWSGPAKNLSRSCNC